MQHPLGLVLLVGFLAGCNTKPECHPCRTTALANVYVRTQSGAAVAGARLVVLAFRDACGGFQLGGESNVVTDANGHRRMLISSLYSPQTARCILVAVDPEPGDRPPESNSQ